MSTYESTGRGHVPTAAVFVVGAPRSGTSAVAWALAQHPSMATGPEADFPYHVARLFGAGAAAEGGPREGLPPLEAAFESSVRRSDGWLARMEVGREEFVAAIGQGLDALFSSRYGGRRWIDSTPACALVCPQLALMFPAAKFVHMLRDGRAAVSSMIHSGFDTRVARDFAFACETWRQCARRAHDFALERPDRCIEVRQEELASDPEAVVERLCAFLELEREPAVVEFLRRGRINSSWGNASLEDVRRHKPADVVPASPWESWTSKERSVFAKVAGDTMRLFGYGGAGD